MDRWQMRVSMRESSGSIDNTREGWKDALGVFYTRERVRTKSDLCDVTVRLSDHC